MQNFCKTMRSKTFWLRTVLPFLLAIVAAFIARYQLELSDGVTPDYMAGQWPLYAPLNAFTAFCLTLVLFAFIGRWSLATGISGGVFTLLAIVNYYTRDLHGTALMPQDILNIGTAAAVMGSYTLRITQTVITIVALLLPVLAISVAQRFLAYGRGKPPKISWKRRLARWAGCFASIFVILYVGYFAPFAIKPKQTYGWAWQLTYYKYGYLAGTIESAGLLMNPIVEPDNYSDEAADEAAARADSYTPAVETVSEQEYPDIVLILSESFYDFDLVTDLQTDVEVMSVTKNLENSIYGHTVSPQVGGGTNSSEYEMLTSNSLMLMPSITPFNWLNLYGADSIVSYLEDLGYSTMAAHPYTNLNYRRNSAWLALGFDQVYFEDSFPTKEYYGNRPYQTDSATYKDLEAMYESMPEDQPRFTFLVSIQSHGDYDMNDVVVVVSVDRRSDKETGKVELIRINWELKAAGAAHLNAFAVQLDKVRASEVAGVETTNTTFGRGAFAGSGPESGSELAVIPLFNTSQEILGEGTYINTTKGVAIPTVKHTTTVTFAQPVDPAAVRESALNAFIVVNQKSSGTFTREKEIHIPGRKPTQFAVVSGNTFLESDPYRYFVTKGDGVKNNYMMWALCIPGEFRYPLERSDIRDVYTYFNAWAASGGREHVEWYRDEADETLLY